MTRNTEETENLTDENVDMGGPSDLPEGRGEYDEQEDEFGEEQFVLPQEDPVEVQLFREFFDEINLPSKTILNKREMKPLILFHALHQEFPNLGWNILADYYMKLKKSEGGHSFNKMQEMYRGNPTFRQEGNDGLPAQYRPPSKGGEF